jgi:hypothetical protein
MTVELAPDRVKRKSHREREPKQVLIAEAALAWRRLHLKIFF